MKRKAYDELINKREELYQGFLDAVFQSKATNDEVRKIMNTYWELRYYDIERTHKG